MWFTETPWPPIVVCAMLAMGLVAAMFFARRGVYIVGIVALVVASVAIYLVERQIVTDREQVEACVYGVVGAFQKRDLNATLEFFSPRDEKDRAFVAWALLMIKSIENVRITGMEIVVRGEGSRAVSHFRANADIVTAPHGNLGRQNSRWQIDWQREAGNWRIIEIHRLDPYSDKELRLKEQNP